MRFFAVDCETVQVDVSSAKCLCFSAFRRILGAADKDEVGRSNRLGPIFVKPQFRIGLNRFARFSNDLVSDDAELCHFAGFLAPYVALPRVAYMLATFSGDSTDLRYTLRTIVPPPGRGSNSKDAPIVRAR